MTTTTATQKKPNATKADEARPAEPMPPLAIPPATATWKAGGSIGRLGEVGNCFNFTALGGADVTARLGFMGSGASMEDMSEQLRSVIRAAAAKALECPEAKRLEQANARLESTLQSIAEGKARLSAIEQERRGIDVLNPDAGERLASLGREEGTLRRTLAENEPLLQQLRPAVHRLTELVGAIVAQFGTDAARALLEQLGRQRAAILTELAGTIAEPLNNLLAIDSAMFGIARPDVVTAAVKGIVTPPGKPTAEAGEDDTSGSAVGIRESARVRTPVEPMARSHIRQVSYDKDTGEEIVADEA